MFDFNKIHATPENQMTKFLNEKRNERFSIKSPLFFKLS